MSALPPALEAALRELHDRSPGINTLRCGYACRAMDELRAAAVCGRASVVGEQLDALDRQAKKRTRNGEAQRAAAIRRGCPACYRKSALIQRLANRWVCRWCQHIVELPP